MLGRAVEIGPLHKLGQGLRDLVAASASKTSNPREGEAISVRLDRARGPRAATIL